MKKHDKFVSKLQRNGWQVFEEYPAAKTANLLRDTYILTVRNGRELPGYHPPKN